MERRRMQCSECGALTSHPGGLVVTQAWIDPRKKHNWVPQEDAAPVTPETAGKVWWNLYNVYRSK
jgi:hypothetical protein